MSLCAHANQASTSILNPGKKINTTLAVKPSKISNINMKQFFFIFLITLIIYFLSSPGETPYNYFTRLSSSFLSGKLYLTQNPPWLNELIPIKDKYYVVYPPMPAIILMPYVLLFGEHSSQTLFSIILGSINVGLVYLLCKKIKLTSKTSIWVTLFFGFGTNHWYLASIGSAWFLAHIVAVFFLLLSLIEVFGKQRLILIGLLLGFSFWSRTTVIFTLPFFYIFFWKRFLPINMTSILNFFFLNIGIIFFILLDAEYNFLRFGNFSPFAPYYLIPNINSDPIFKNGFMSLKFIPRHIDAILFRLPKLTKTFPFLIPSLYSTAIWFTSPAILFIFKAKDNLIIIACWAAIILTLSVTFLWAGVGYAQFGYRFIQDIMPFLLILMAYGFGQKPGKIAICLIILSIIINTWGVILINKFNVFII